MAEAAWMASPVAGARILHERIGKAPISFKRRPAQPTEEAEVSVPMSLLLSWTSSSPDDDESDGDGRSRD